MTHTTPCKLCGEIHEEREDRQGHHCPDWDFLFVRAESQEADACLCFKGQHDN